MIMMATTIGGGHSASPAVKEKKLTLKEYIETYRDLAIEEMVFSGIPASVTMAQGILESAYGNSNLAINGHNHFGMKCKPEWTGETITVCGDCYKKYPSDYDSLKSNYFRIYLFLKSSILPIFTNLPLLIFSILNKLITKAGLLD